VEDECQVLTLFGSERWGDGWVERRRRCDAHFKGVFAKIIEDTNLENRPPSTENGADGPFGGGV
jgi:hypothetical protein